MDKTQIVYIINHAAFFASHRLSLAAEAKKQGYEVSVITGQEASKSTEPLAVCEVERAGIKILRTAFTSDGLNPLRELLGILQIALHLNRIKPAIIHCASPKGVLYGGIAARLLKIPTPIYSVSGMGFAFTNGHPSLIRRLSALVIKNLGKMVFSDKGARIIVQNTEDAAELIKMYDVTQDCMVLIPGSGVDCDRYSFVQMAQKEPLILFSGRIIEDKGIREFVSAARILKREFPQWRFLAAGPLDYRNPGAIPSTEISSWRNEADVEFVGHMSSMVQLYQSASITCLPSYREGLPKALLEGSAAGCAIVATDAVGCRDAVIPGVTGDLVPVRNAGELATALRNLILDFPRRESYGVAGRKLMETQFALPAINGQIMNLYSQGQSAV